ncbi:MAG: tetratricopeptide repeat protein [Alphaproteobacteria bacterium]
MRAVGGLSLLALFLVAGVIPALAQTIGGAGAPPVAAEQWQLTRAYGLAAYGGGDYVLAADQLERALRFAKTYGSHDFRRPISLVSLAEVYRADGRFAEAEPMLVRALDLWSVIMAGDHPTMIPALQVYARLLRQTGRPDEAAALAAREAEIRRTLDSVADGG